MLVKPVTRRSGSVTIAQTVVIQTVDSSELKQVIQVLLYEVVRVSS